jgi:hypothetical protein
MQRRSKTPQVSKQESKEAIRTKAVSDRQFTYSYKKPPMPERRSYKNHPEKPQKRREKKPPFNEEQRGKRPSNVSIPLCISQRK